MMRRLRLSAASSHIATRTKVTGFSLFTQEMQQEQRVLSSKSLRAGQANMRVMSKLWSKLTKRRKELYNERARQRSLLKVRDSMKKNNTFNLLMRLLGSEEILQNVGDETFMAHVARNTMLAMKPKDAEKLRTRMKVSHKAPSQSNAPCTSTSTFKRFANPHMMFFDSFTEMQHSVAPTRHTAFTAISKLVSLCNVSEAGEEFVVKSFDALSREDTLLFAPISDAEAPYFEVFCATRCGTLDFRCFNILQLFMAFRGIDAAAPPQPQRERIYRSLLSSDRSHDGVFYRARRCLERLENLRSSECGVYIAQRASQPATVPTTAYGIENSSDDVMVATLLAETRRDQSVYDDILVRASMLRSDKNKALLDVYQVRLEETATQQRALRKRHAHVEKLAEREAEDVLRVTEVESVTTTAKAKAHATSRVAAVATAPKKKAQSRPASPAKKAATAKKTFVAAAAEPAAPAKTPRSTRVAASAPAHQPRRPAAVKKTEEEEEEEEVWASSSAVEAAPSFAPKKSRKSATVVAKADESYGVEEFLAGEASDSFDSEDAFDDVQFSAQGSAAQEAEREEVTTAPAQRSAKEKRRTARSQLTDPQIMLPAKARAQKLITKHASTRKAMQPTTASPQPSPYVPPQRNTDFTASIRALLSNSM